MRSPILKPLGLSIISADAVKTDADTINVVAKAENLAFIDFTSSS